MPERLKGGEKVSIKPGFERGELNLVGKVGTVLDNLLKVRVEFDLDGEKVVHSFFQTELDVVSTNAASTSDQPVPRDVRRVGPQGGGFNTLGDRGT